MDSVDDANDTQQALLDMQIANIRRQNNSERLPHINKCHFCQEPIEKGLFCDMDCAEDYEKLERHHKHRG